MRALPVRGAMRAVSKRGGVARAPDCLEMCAEKDDIIAASGGPAQIYWELLDTRTGRSYPFEPHVPR